MAVSHLIALELYKKGGSSTTSPRKRRSQLFFWLRMVALDPMLFLKAASYQINGTDSNHARSHKKVVTSRFRGNVSGEGSLGKGLGKIYVNICKYL